MTTQGQKHCSSAMDGQCPGVEVDSKNPLMNHLIVTNVMTFGKLQFDELKNFRLVCKLWYTLSLDKWRHTVILRLIENENQEQQENGVTLNELHQLITKSKIDYQDDLLQLTRKPYSRYKLHGWSSTYPRWDSQYKEEGKTFWTNIIAPSVNFLCIQDCYFPDSKQLEEKLFDCINLEELMLIGNSSGIIRCFKIPDKNENKFPILTKLKSLTVSGEMPLQWSQLLLNTPNLENLTIKQNGSFDRATFAQFLLDLHQLEYSGRNPMNLKNLDISEAHDTFTDFVSLSSRNLKLESLSILFEQVRPEHFMEPLLLAQQRSLKILKLCRLSNRVDQHFGPFEFPYSVNMPNLRELHIWGNIVKNFDFLRFLPNLKVLFISRDLFEKRHLIGKNIWNEVNSGELEILEDLVLGQDENPVRVWEVNNFNMNGMEVLCVDCKFSVESVKLLKRWMPNLKTFGAVLNVETLKVVLEQWPNLREIKIMYGSDVDDDGFGNIFRISGLEKIQFDAYCNQSRLTDGVFKKFRNYFGQMTGLKSMEICVSEKMSNKMETEVQKAFLPANIKFIRNYKNHFHDCCERMAYKEPK